MPCKHTYVMHIQMHHISLWACSPYLCAQILIDPLIFIFLPLCHLFTIFVHYFSPFVINDHKGSILYRLRLSMSINEVRIIFPNLIQSRTLFMVTILCWMKTFLWLPYQQLTLVLLGTRDTLLCYPSAHAQRYIPIFIRCLTSLVVHQLTLN